MLYGSENSNKGSVSTWGGGVGREMGGSFMLRSDKKQQNSVKQLSFNKKI